MAFETETRNRLNKFVSDAKELLTDEFTNQFQQDYGLDPDTGEVADLERLSHLDDARRQTAIILRDTLAHYYANLPTKQKKQESDNKQLIERIIREQAFTILNRLCAIRMAEARDLVIESIASGPQSKGFQLYQPVVGNSLGDTGEAYQQYLLSIFDEFAADLPVLFDRFSPQGRLFPRESVLTELLGLINDPEINQLWAEDETIGWIYQYFNSKEERKAMRDASQAPRNSRELAVRNQFFTPRYVVEFLTDNTLGRIWYEMRKGETDLKDTCQYLVRRPNEIFLAADEKAPETEESKEEKDLTQEELLNQPVHIPHRPLKDPREIRMLDPACGSMHFGLYAFDIYLKIYEEFWDMCVADPDAVTNQLQSTNYQLPSLSFSEKAEFMKAAPRLIIEHNIHGIDIDPRAVQIAGLSLWLRAQRAWKSLGIAAADRPQITRSNVVCAEPMPGDQQQLETFCQELHPAIAQMVTAIFEEMKLAGEAGSLLKIEQEISSLVAKAKKQYQDNPPDKKTQKQLFGGAGVRKEQQLEFDLSGITDEQFFEKAEEAIYEALRKYAKETSEGGFRRKLFAGDAEKGFAFIEAMRVRFDAVLMNPPFGAPVLNCKDYIQRNWPNAKHDIYAVFVERAIGLISENSLIGAITSRTGFFLKTYEAWRERIVLKESPPVVFADLGAGVLDAALVETAAYCLLKCKRRKRSTTACNFYQLLEFDKKGDDLLAAIREQESAYTFSVATEELQYLPGSPFCYWIEPEIRRVFVNLERTEGDGRDVRFGASPKDRFRFVRLNWEVPNEVLGSVGTQSNPHWVFFAKGGEFAEYIADMHLCLAWKDDGAELKAHISHYRGSRGWGFNWTASLNGYPEYGRPAITWTLRTSSDVSFRALPVGCIFADKGPALLIEENDQAALSRTLAILNSSTYKLLVDCTVAAGDSAARSYEVGVIQRTPFPKVNSNDAARLTDMAEAACQLALAPHFAVETSQYFTSPALLNVEGDTLDARIKSHLATENTRQKKLRASKQQIDSLCYRLFRSKDASSTESSICDVDSTSDAKKATKSVKAELAFGLVSWCVGVSFGRFSVQLEDPPTRLQPFDRIPTRSFATIGSEGVANEVLVDDNSNTNDIVKRIRNSLDAAFDDAENTWTELCGLLTPRDHQFRDWFAKEFFKLHLHEYGKSRREAPIYWPISTESGSYTLWFYYHRLTDQTLYKAINDFVDPKLKDEIRPSLKDLRAIHNRSSAQEKELAHLTELESELEQFKADLLEIAAFWKPNLNDGVQITAAPLWKFFRLTKWRNKLKKTWEELESGKYDWAHLALSIWPERVVKDKCTTDRSIAIAHDLEEQLWHEVDVTSTSRGGRETTKKQWKPRDLSESQLDAIVEAVKQGDAK